MGGRSHLAFEARTKAIIWVVFALVAWRILISDTVLNSLLGLVFAGVVPGTDIVLSPAAMINWVYGIAGFGVFLLLLRVIFVRYRRNRASTYEGELPPVQPDQVEQPAQAKGKKVKATEGLPELATDAPVAKAAKPVFSLAAVTLPAVPRVALKRPAFTVPKRPHIRMRQSSYAAYALWVIPRVLYAYQVVYSTVAYVAAFAWSLFASAATLAYRGAYYLLRMVVFAAATLARSVATSAVFVVTTTGKVARVVFVQAGAGAQHAARGVRYAGKRLAQGARFTVQAIRYDSAVIWSRTKPYIYAFDRYVERRVKASGAYMNKKLRQSDDIDFTMNIIRETVKRTRNTADKNEGESD